MLGMNEVIINNIQMIMQRKAMKQVNLASKINVSREDLNKMLNGGRMINAVELASIAKAMDVSIDELVKIPSSRSEVNVIRAFMGDVNTPEAKHGLEIADELADLICFHAQCRENGEQMMEPWES